MNDVPILSQVAASAGALPHGVRTLRPEEYGHTVVIGGTPIACTTWSLPDEDDMTVAERLKTSSEIATALQELAAVDDD